MGKIFKSPNSKKRKRGTRCSWKKVRKNTRGSVHAVNGRSNGSRWGVERGHDLRPHFVSEWLQIDHVGRAELLHSNQHEEPHTSSSSRYLQLGVVLNPRLCGGFSDLELPRELKVCISCSSSGFHLALFLLVQDASTRARCTFQKKSCMQ